MRGHTGSVLGFRSEAKAGPLFDGPRLSHRLGAHPGPAGAGPNATAAVPGQTGSDEWAEWAEWAESESGEDAVGAGVPAEHHLLFPTGRTWNSLKTHAKPAAVATSRLVREVPLLQKAYSFLESKDLPQLGPLVACISQRQLYQTETDLANPHS